MEGLTLFVKDVKSKGELSELDDLFVQKICSEIFKEYPEKYEVLVKNNWNKKSKVYKFFFKEVRKKLRIIFGAFTLKTLKEKTKKNILDGKKDNEFFLSHHSSSNERLEIYDDFYEVIKDEKSVLDLGCGYNPFSYRKGKKYLASDINKDDLKLFEGYFKAIGIDGSCEYLDLTDKKCLDKLEILSKDFDVTLMLKLVDTLESIERNITLKLLQKLQSKKIILSFPLMSLGGKKQIKSKRIWLDRFIESVGFHRKDLTIGNELFVILERYT